MTELTADLVLRAYAAGLFPMAESGSAEELYWVDPEWRGIIPLEDFHLPRRLARTIRGDIFEVRCDTAFAEVIACCAEARPERRDTWINSQITQLYTELYDGGNAHSVECWRDGLLVGGLYGVSLGGAFFGESMFTRETDASKVALANLAARLRMGGYGLLDTQFLTRHLERFGAIEIARDDYREKLEAALALDARFYSEALSSSGVLDALHSRTQTS